MKQKVHKFPCKDGFTAVLETVTKKEWWAELAFHPTRKWRFDYACPEAKLAIEIDGGIFTRGRHSNGIGQKNDMEKGNAAVECGWVVLHYVPEDKLTSPVIDQIKKIAENRIKFLHAE